MTEASQYEQKVPGLDGISAKLLGAQERNAEILTSANDILVKTAKAIGEHQTEFLQLEAEQVTKAFTPIKVDTDAGAAISAYGSQLHENSQKMISHMRTINDLVLDCSWRIFKLCADSFRSKH